MRGTPGVLEIATASDPQLVHVSAPAGWSVERAKDKPLRFTITSPEASLAREGDIVVRLADAAGQTSALIGCRPSLTGRLGVEIRSRPQGGKPAIEVTVSNQSLQSQTVTWSVTLMGERSLINGAYAAPAKTAAYFGDAGTGSLAGPGRQPGAGRDIPLVWHRGGPAVPGRRRDHRCQRGWHHHRRGRTRPLSAAPPGTQRQVTVTGAALGAMAQRMMRFRQVAGQRRRARCTHRHHIVGVPSQAMVTVKGTA
jgi:hypothetical protein